MDYSNWQYNGLTFGDGTRYQIVETDGFNDMPPILSADVVRAGDHGMFQGQDLLGARIMTIKFCLAGTSRSDYDSLLVALAQAFVVQPFPQSGSKSAELPLVYQGSAKRIMCRARKFAAPRPMAQHGTFGYPLVELVATDPRIYDANLQTLTTGLAQQSSGVGFNVTFPVTFGATGTGGTLSCANNGTFETRPTFAITGPVVNPIVDNLSTGQSLVLLITLANSDTLVIDASTKSVTLNGTASRTSSLQTGSQWWNLPPGVTLIRFRNNGAYSGATQFTCSFRNAWLVA